MMKYSYESYLFCQKIIPWKAWRLQKNLRVKALKHLLLNNSDSEI